MKRSRFTEKQIIAILRGREVRLDDGGCVPQHHEPDHLW